MHERCKELLSWVVENNNRGIWVASASAYGVNTVLHQNFANALLFTWADVDFFVQRLPGEVFYGHLAVAQKKVALVGAEVTPGSETILGTGCNAKLDCNKCIGRVARNDKGDKVVKERGGSIDAYSFNGLWVFIIGRAENGVQKLKVGNTFCKGR